MPRPKVPLISRRMVYEAALRIIDDEGLDAVSTRRLGQEIGVNGTSLYYHFKSMDEVLSGAAGLALSEVRTPDEQDAHWREWFPENVLRTRRVLLKHPNLIPLMFDRRRLGIGERDQDSTVRRLLDEGVPLRAIMPLMVTFESYAIGSALHETQDRDERLHMRDAEFPDLARARRETGMIGEALLKLTIASIIDTVLAATENEHKTPKKPARKSRPRKTLRAARDTGFDPASAEAGAKTARFTADGSVSRKMSTSLKAPLPRKAPVPPMP